MSDHPAAASDGGTSLTLLGRLRTDDPTAWGRLVHLYGPLVRQWAARRGVTAADADDVAQEVFTEVARGLAGFRRDRPADTFRGWLFGVTRNVLLRHAERVARQPQAAGGTAALERFQVVAADTDNDTDDEPPAERNALYRRALALVEGEFEPKTWAMFLAHMVDGRTPAEVAATAGVSAATVRQAKSRVLRRLREEVGELLD